MTTLSSKPYLIRALYDWIVDSELTPYIIVDAYAKDAQLPMDFVDDGKIILNISPTACRGLTLENDRIVFTGRFGGSPLQVFIPPQAVLAIYAKENGGGMVFGEDSKDGFISDKHQTLPSTQPRQVEKPSVSKKRPALKVVKKTN